MPPKLRKDRSNQGSKVPPTSTNMYNILNDDHQTKMSAKTTTDKTTVVIPSQTPAETQMKTLQNYKTTKQVNITTKLQNITTKLQNKASKLQY